MVAWTGPKNRTELSFSGLVRDPDILGMKFFDFESSSPDIPSTMLLRKNGPIPEFLFSKIWTEDFEI